MTNARGFFLGALLVGIGAQAVSCASQTAGGPSGGPAIKITRLRCEHLPDPLGIDVRKPRLGWNLDSSERGQRQTAYQIEAKGGDGAVAWDTGKVASAEMINIEWGGRPLTSRERVRWRVRVWDMLDRPSDWSEPASFEMGLLEPGDWTGSWIAAAAKQDYIPPTPMPDGKTRWIWGGDAPTAAADGPRMFRGKFELPPGKRIRSIRGTMGAAGGFVLYANGIEAARSDTGEWLVPITVTPVYAGTNVLAIEAKRGPGAAGWLVGRFVVEFAEGPPLTIATGADFRVSAQAADGWRGPTFDDASWTPAKELPKPAGRFVLPPKVPPAPLLRKTFELAKPVRSARAYVAGLGYHEFYVNGHRIGDHVLDPGFTRYDKRALYVTHDVTAALAQGKNAVGVMLGNGFLNPHWQDVWDFHKAPWRMTPRLRLQLHVTYEDGSTEVVSSDETWLVSTGPVLLDGVRNGETYDARQEKRGWAAADYDDAAWAKAPVVPAPAGALSAQMSWPIKVTETLKPRRVTEVKPGVFVFDLGQNFAGWARIRVKGAAGTTIKLRYGERLGGDGTLDQSKIWPFVQQGPFQTDTYVLKGDGVETWEPRFTYHGFQYVEVTGWPGKPTVESLDGRVVHTAAPQIGKFESSNALLNQIFAATLWSYRSNFHSVPTDCPHREKNGWMGDGHLGAEQAMFTFDNAATYTKWVRDIVDEQKATGELPGIVPTSGWGYQWGNGPAWDSALLLVPSYMYTYLGDRRVLESNYDSMKRYVDYLSSRDYMEKNPSGWLGDWVHLQQKTPEAVTHAGFHVRDALIVARTARLLGRADEAKKYEAVAADVRRRFQAKYVDARTGTIATGSQTAQSCALYEGLVGATAAGKVLAKLLANIDGQKGRLEAGILGTKCLPWALTAAGRADVAYSMASAREFPGWGNWFSKGATTLWEDWKGEASLNHIFLGDIVAWYFRALAGINPDPESPGFARIVFRPEVVGDLSWVHAETLSVRGKISSRWFLNGGVLSWTITVPVGSTAQVHVPAPTRNAVRIDDGATFVRSEQGRQLFEVGSGTWTFVVAG